MTTLQSPWPAIKIVGEYEPTGKGPAMDLERRVAYGLVNMPANALSQDGVEVTELRYTPRDGGWLLMLKGTRRGNKLIAFVWDESFAQVLRTAATLVDSGHTPWRAEEPPPWLK